MDLNWLEHNLDRLLVEIEHLAASQAAAQGRVDQRLQKFEHALRPLAQRLDRYAKALSSHYHLLDLQHRQRWQVADRHRRFSIDQSVRDRRHRLDLIAARIRRIRDAVDRGYGGVGRAGPGDVVALARQIGGFGDDLAKLQALVQERPDDVAQFLRSPQPSLDHGGLLATAAFLVLYLWKKAREAG